LLPDFYRRGMPAPPPTNTAQFWLHATELANQRPGLAARNCSLGRRWDQLHYLLSANRRGDSADSSAALFDSALRGRPLTGVFPGQGIPTAYTSTAQEVPLIVID
jgi:hypothetical protein